MLKKSEKFKQVFLLFIIVVLLVLPYFVFAADLKGSLKALGDASGYQTDNVTETSLAGVIGMIVSAFLGILGVIFVILIVIAGNKWMTAMGEEEKVREAKDTIRRAIIGLIIVVGAYAIWAYVALQLIED